MGENGAGKSTLIRCSQGSTGRRGADPRSTARRCALTARRRCARPSASASSTRSCIVPSLSVAENMHLDHPYPRRASACRLAPMNGTAEAALGRFGA
jgi:ribose transport system ATP-binding protein